MNKYDSYISYQDAVTKSLTNLYDRIISFLPNVLMAGIILLLGWIIGSFLGGLLRRALEALGADKLSSNLGLERLAEKSGHSFHIPKIVEWVVKWFCIIAAIIAAADVLGMQAVTDFFYRDVLSYAGHVIVAMVILLLGIIAANFFSDLVESAVRAGGFESSRILGALTKWSILIFAVLAALTELQIASSFLQDFFRAIIFMLAIAGGLAFGMGGRDHARKVLDYIESNITKRQ